MEGIAPNPNKRQHLDLAQQQQHDPNDAFAGMSNAPMAMPNSQQRPEQARPKQQPAKEDPFASFGMNAFR